MHKGQVLIVDDLPDVRVTISGLLTDAGYEVRSASNMTEALDAFGKETFQIAVLDVRLDETNEDNKDGLLLMHEINRRSPATAIIILTGYADVKMVRDALQPGIDGIPSAFGFLEKNEINRIVDSVDQAFAHVIRTGKLSIETIIGQGENDHVEFKSSIRWDYGTNSANKTLQEVLATTIAGMLNSKGGTLLIGVADNGTILGIENDLQTLAKKDRDGFQLALTDIVKTYLGVTYIQHVHARFESVRGKQICVLSVDKSPSPVFLTRGEETKFWVRMNNSTRCLDVRDAMNYIEANWQ